MMRQHEAIMQDRAPARQSAFGGVQPEAGDERAHQELLGKRHAGVRRHFEAAEFHQPKPPRRPVRRKQLVDADLGAVGIAGDIGQQVAEQPIGQPGQRRGPTARRRHLRHGDLELIKTVMARLVDARRLAVGPMNMPENR